jgi:hypothetical protein
MQLGCVCSRAGARRAELWHRPRVDEPAARAGFQRFADALNRPRDPAVLRAAVTDAVQIDRHPPGEIGAAPIMESFTGIAEVEHWFSRTPAVVRFSLAGAAVPDPDPDGDGAGGDGDGGGGDGDSARWRIAYAYDAGDFHHGGIWVARLACDGRIAALSHHPYALREPSGTPHVHGGAGHSHSG